jgi:hypothetical protein
MRGAILPLHQYVFMTWCLGIGTTVPLPYRNGPRGLIFENMMMMMMMMMMMNAISII